MSKKSIWIGELLHKVEMAMRKDFGYGDSSIIAYRPALNEIQRYFIQNNGGYYLPKIGERMLKEKTEYYHSRSYGSGKIAQFRRICCFMEQYYEGGKLTILKLPRYGCESNAFFASLIDWYADVFIEHENYAFKTILNRKRAIAKFLLFLEQRGHKNLDTVNANDIRAYLPEIAKCQPKSMSSTLSIIKKFLIALNDDGVHNQNWWNILDVRPPKHRVMRTAFTKYEVARILRAADDGTLLGMRDTAMMVLAANTGLRAVDITNLRMSDINWHANEIIITQHKTGVVLGLPLFAEVGNAIAKYILNGRPKIENEYIFLTATPPHKKLEAGGAGIIQRYMKKAGYTKKQRHGKGFHSFRRAIGTQLLEAEIPLETISQILGHSSPEAIRPYLGIDLSHLKECALDLTLFPCLRGELC